MRRSDGAKRRPCRSEAGRGSRQGREKRTQVVSTIPGIFAAFSHPPTRDCVNCFGACGAVRGLPAACSWCGAPALCSRAPPASRALRVGCADGLRPPLTPEPLRTKAQALTGRPGACPGWGARAPHQEQKNPRSLQYRRGSTMICVRPVYPVPDMRRPLPTGTRQGPSFWSETYSITRRLGRGRPRLRRCCRRWAVRTSPDTASAARNRR